MGAETTTLAVGPNAIHMQYAVCTRYSEPLRVLGRTELAHGMTLVLGLLNGCASVFLS